MKISTKRLQIPSICIFLAFSIWWLFIAIKGLQGSNKPTAELFSAVYGVMAFLGGIAGLIISQKWGGFKSLIGKSIGFISLGLLAQEFGQVVYSYLGAKMTEIPYPSIGDIGYFGSIFLYIAGLFFLIKALKVKGTLKQTKNIAIAVLIPLLLLIATYKFFLGHYEADFSQKLVILLDFGYPLGQAFYFALALVAYLLSRKYLGGVMKPVVILLIAALLAQYAADFTFLYSNSRGTWQSAGINDYMYLVSYFIMTLSLLRFGVVVDKLSPQQSNNKAENVSEGNE